MKLPFLILQTLCLIALAPLVSGLIRKLKNNFRMRRGAPVLQPYFNLAKLFSKGEVVSETTSWIFTATPYIVLAAAVTALFIVPVGLPASSANLAGDCLLVLFVLAAGRFFLALAGLDAGSAFGGMGSSREMFISSFAEPAAILAVFAVGFNRGSTSFASIVQGGPASFSTLLAALALFLVALAETSRIPVDNQETHLELTMIHEAMVLEYSGRSLALLELAAHVKQLVFFSLIALALLPAGGFSLFAAYGFFCTVIAVLIAAVAVIEVSVAKMRLFRAVDFLAFAFIISGMSVVASVIGI